MASKETTSASHINGTHPPRRAAHQPRKKAAAKAARASQATKAERGPQFGRMIALGAFALLGVVFVLGAASVAALLAGYEPPGHEAEARRLRRYALAHRPDLSKDVWEPVGKQLGRSERWVRQKIHNATR